MPTPAGALSDVFAAFRNVGANDFPPSLVAHSDELLRAGKGGHIGGFQPTQALEQALRNLNPEDLPSSMDPAAAAKIRGALTDLQRARGGVLDATTAAASRGADNAAGAASAASAGAKNPFTAKRVFGGLLATSFIIDSQMQSSSECYTDCLTGDNPPLEPVGIHADDGVPSNLKSPNCPEGEEDCTDYCSTSSGGACSEEQRRNRSRYQCGLSLSSPSPTAQVTCSADTIDNSLNNVFDFWAAFGHYILYIAVIIGIAVALWAFKIFSGAYVNKSRSNISTSVRGAKIDGLFKDAAQKAR